MDQTPDRAPQVAEVVAFLADRDVPCPRCRYNLRGNTSASCPECACPLTVGIKENLPGARRVMLPVMIAAFAGAFAGLMQIVMQLRFRFGRVSFGSTAMTLASDVWSAVGHAGTLAYLVAGVLALVALQRNRIAPSAMWVVSGVFDRVWHLRDGLRGGHFSVRHGPSQLHSTIPRERCQAIQARQHRRVQRGGGSFHRLPQGRRPSYR